jgi:CHASE3 domain sensor protein
MEYQGLEARTVNNSPPQRTTWLSDRPIATRLGLAFAVIVLLTIVLSVVSYIASSSAQQAIQRTDEQRVPTTLTVSAAQADLLRMLASTRGYLALGDTAFRESYARERQAFEADLLRLDSLSSNFATDNRERLRELRERYNSWSAQIDELFALRDDQLEREPAYKLLATSGTTIGGGVLISTQNMINSQKLQDPTAENIELLGDMASFQGSFAALFSGLRSYVTTRNPIFKREYEANRVLNELAWENLSRKRDRLNPNLQATLDEIDKGRQEFFTLPEQLFTILEGDSYRTDLALFRDQVVPEGDAMNTLLDQITQAEQNALRNELADGREGLQQLVLQLLVGGGLAVVLGIAMALFFRANIAGPIRRLTGVAERIRSGDLTAQAAVESGDETGTLAMTFNRMTGQLRGTLEQVQNEKKRADDLLEVVIPIGVALSSERDFNRLLERMLGEARAFCGATAGVLYLRTEDNRLQYVLAQDEQRGINVGGSKAPIPYDPVSLYDAEEPNERNAIAYATLHGITLNLPTTHSADMFEAAGRDFAATADYQSQLILPLTSSQGRVIGVLQLCNAQNSDHTMIVPFDASLQQSMESFSSLAAAALEAYSRERSLRQEIRQLRIEIDEAKRQKQVSEIVDTDFFQGLQAKVRALRARKGGEAAPAAEENVSESDVSAPEAVGDEHA